MTLFHHIGQFTVNGNEVWEIREQMELNIPTNLFRSETNPFRNVKEMSKVKFFRKWSHPEIAKLELEYELIILITWSIISKYNNFLD